MSYISMTWWKFFTVSVIILVTFKKVFPDHYKKILGLNLSPSKIVQCVFAFIAMMIFSEFYVDWTLDHSQILRTGEPWLSFWPIQPICQALNEEMVGRAGLFYFLSRFIKKSMARVLIVAILFTFSHNLFFWLKESVVLTLLTTASLFFAALATNLIFLNSRHIGWVWVLHSGWNARQFGAKYVWAKTGIALSDGEKFNALEGQYSIFYLCLLLLLSTWTYVLFIKKSYQHD